LPGEDGTRMTRIRRILTDFYSNRIKIICKKSATIRRIRVIRVRYIIS